MVAKKSRFSRWSQLKSKGGASVEEDAAAHEVAENRMQAALDADTSDTTAVDEFSIQGEFPEKRHKRPAAPVMAPLAGFEESDSPFEAPPEAALAMLNGELAHDPEPGTNSVIPVQNAVDDQERDLTEDEAAYVSTLPPIDQLTNESDFTPFMSGKVPEFLRRKALRVLYQSHPILGFRDGLNDYDEDYNIIDKLIDAATQTSYKVGKGQAAAQEVEDEEATEVVDQDDEAPLTNDELANNQADGEAETPDLETEDSDEGKSVQGAGEELPEEAESAAEGSTETQSIRDVRKPEK